MELAAHGDGIVEAVSRCIEAHHSHGAIHPQSTPESRRIDCLGSALSLYTAFVLDPQKWLYVPTYMGVGSCSVGFRV